MLRKSQMHEYQDRIATALYETDEAIAVLPMGAGKTVISMTAMLELFTNGEIRGATIFAPKRVAAREWMHQWADWEHLQPFGDLISHVAGSPVDRLAALADHRPFKLVGIENTPWMVEQIESWDRDDPRLDLLCIDEISRYKAAGGKWSREIVLVADRFKTRWGLTGSPRPGGELQLYMPVRIIARSRIWPEPFEEWRMRYFMPDNFYTQLRWNIRDEWRDKIWADAAEVMITVPADELPPKPLDEPVVHWVDLPPRAMLHFRDMVRHLVTEIGGDTIKAVNRAVASGKVDQIAQGFIYDDGQTMSVLHRGKVKVLEDLVERLVGEQALITYHFAEDLRLIRHAFPDIAVLGEGTDRGDAELIRQWNAGELQLLAVHPASAGHGLNLQKSHARQIIHFCLTWSPELYAQVVARLARQGNRSGTVFSHLILARETSDELKLARVLGSLEAERRFVEYLAETL